MRHEVIHFDPIDFVAYLFCDVSVGGGCAGAGVGKSVIRRPPYHGSVA